jgi:hypothetical protein
MQRIVLRTSDDHLYSIDREYWIIRNVVKALNAWNEARTISSKNMFEEAVVELPAISYGQDHIHSPTSGGNKGQPFLIFMMVAFALGLPLVFILFGDSSKISPDLGASFIMILILVSPMLIVVNAFSGAIDGLASASRSILMRLSSTSRR